MEPKDRHAEIKGEEIAHKSLHDVRMLGGGWVHGDKRVVAFVEPCIERAVVQSAMCPVEGGVFEKRTEYDAPNVLPWRCDVVMGRCCRSGQLIKRTHHAQKRGDEE